MNDIVFLVWIGMGVAIIAWGLNKLYRRIFKKD